MPSKKKRENKGDSKYKGLALFGKKGTGFPPVLGNKRKKIRGWD